MASPRASVASYLAPNQRKHSVDRYQRQAELSLKIEEGRSKRAARLSEARAVHTSFNDFDFKPREDSEDLPTSLTRADTIPQSPFDEYHPGDRVDGPRRLTVKYVRGSFVKPFDEPDLKQQQSIEQRFASTRASKAEEIDPEYAQSQIQRLASNASRKKSGLHRLFDRILGRPAIKPGAFSGLEFISSLPTAHAHAVVLRGNDPLAQRRTINVLEYKLEPSGMMNCAPPCTFYNVESLRQYLEQDTTSALRLIYTCNYDEAINFLSSEFGISSASTEAGERSFREYMQGDRDSRRANNKAIRWRPAFDTARQVICSAFAVDFGSIFVPEIDGCSPSQIRAGLYESNHRQRIAVYLQRPTTAKQPIPRATRFSTGSKSLPSYASTPTIIMCESSAVSEVVSLRPLLGLDNPSRLSDEPHIAITHAFESILLHILDGIPRLWKQQIELLHEPHADLEDSIWSQPADSSRAREVWSMSQRLHTMLKHVDRHQKVVEAVQEDFSIFAERPHGGEEWLGRTLDEFDSLGETIRVDYIEPLKHLIDLVSSVFHILYIHFAFETTTSSVHVLRFTTFFHKPLGPSPNT